MSRKLQTQLAVNHERSRLPTRARGRLVANHDAARRTQRGRLVPCAVESAWGHDVVYDIACKRWEGEKKRAEGEERKGTTTRAVRRTRRYAHESVTRGGTTQWGGCSACRRKGKEGEEQERKGQGDRQVVERQELVSDGVGLKQIRVTHRKRVPQDGTIQAPILTSGTLSSSICESGWLEGCSIYHAK